MQLHVRTHTVPTVSCPPSPPFVATKNYLRHFTEKRIFTFPLPSSACQELRFFFFKWLADATLHRADCRRLQRVTATRCVRLHRSFSTSQINQTLVGGGHRSPRLHPRLSNRSRAEGRVEEVVQRCSSNLSWAPDPPQALSTVHSQSAARMDHILTYKTSILNFIKDS